MLLSIWRRNSLEVYGICNLSRGAQKPLGDGARAKGTSTVAHYLFFMFTKQGRRDKLAI